MTLLVFTDLDGSLLEHDSYSVEPARDALRELAEREIPLILNSSKTAAEMASIQEQLGLRLPFICENGAAVWLAGDEVIEFGAPLQSWLPNVHALRQEHNYRFEGFHDWSMAEVAKITGLSAQQAEMAKSRSYSEPILWSDSTEALHEFQQALRALGLQLLQGGRFQSIQSLFDKSDAMRWMIARESKAESGVTPYVVALGDSPNDAAMLDAADTAVIIRSAKSGDIHCPNARNQIHTKLAGPAGWNEAMLLILDQYD